MAASVSLKARPQVVRLLRPRAEAVKTSSGCLGSLVPIRWQYNRTTVRVDRFRPKSRKVSVQNGLSCFFVISPSRAPSQKITMAGGDAGRIIARSASAGSGAARLCHHTFAQQRDYSDLGLL